MKNTIHYMFGIFVFVTLCSQAPLSVNAQVNAEINTQIETRARRVLKESLPPPAVAPRLEKDDFDLLFTSSSNSNSSLQPKEIKSVLLKGAIARRLGIRYRFNGEDDRGYDCSGFIWSVFRDAGADFERTNARALWQQLPKATNDETKQFGTIVFFRGLKHVGIVRDAESFYHASRSKGVTISYFDDYWRKRITGFRRAPKIDTAAMTQKIGPYGSWPVLLKTSKGEE
jgi:cell wall-associated NlpC family hydrolase